MDYEEIIAKLNEMESRYDVGFSSLDRSFLDTLHYDLYGREITNKGCSDCYRDAYMLIKIKLRKDKTMPKKSAYKLKTGVVIQFFGETNYYTNPNLTDEAAERFISLNEDNARLFEVLPDDWRARVGAYLSKSEEGHEEEPLATIAALQQQNEELTLQVETLNKLLAEKTEAEAGEVNTPSEDALLLEGLKDQLGEANAQLEKLTAEVEALRKENRGLKAANTRLKNKEAQEDADADSEDAPLIPESEVTE